MRMWEKRLNDIEMILAQWMHNQGLTNTTPDDCMEELIRQGVYKEPKVKARALAFRNDLRSLRDTYGMPYELGLIRIEQEDEHKPWHIYLVR